MSGARELNYVPNATARALVTGRTNRIAFWVPELTSRFFHGQMCRFHRLLRRDHYEMISGELDWHGSELGVPSGNARMDGNAPYSLTRFGSGLR